MVDGFTRRRVDDQILTTVTEDQGYLHAEGAGTPLMFVDRPPAKLLADAVITNNYDATIQTADCPVHLALSGDPWCDPGAP
jgi:LacI family transcriptional regulator